MAPKQTQWTIEHLAIEEPEAAQYLDDDWDHSTIASTPSLKRANTTTILRNAGEPAHIIISVGQEKRVSLTRRAAKRILGALRKFIRTILAKRRMIETDISTVQPSLGVNGVIV